LLQSGCLTHFFFQSVLLWKVLLHEDNLEPWCKWEITVTTLQSLQSFHIWGKKELRFTDITKDLSHAVVFNLLPEFFNQGYRLFMDSFYTTNRYSWDEECQYKCKTGYQQEENSVIPKILESNVIIDIIMYKKTKRKHINHL
jgi:hypothetical protein